MNNPNLVSRSLNSVWHPCTQMKKHEHTPPLYITRGEGVWLFDENNNKYLDGISSWWVNNLGHNNPKIKQAIVNQLDKLEHVILAGFTHKPVVELSERLAKLTDHNLGHALYASDGACATEIALKMSVHYWAHQGLSQKNQYVHLKNSYHGETAGSLSVTDVATFSGAYQSILRKNHKVPAPDNRLANQEINQQQIALNAAQKLEECLEMHSDKIAAFIIEPLVQGACGMNMYHPSYLTYVRKICDKYKVHLIADEIAVGCGRTGTFFACEQGDIWPDFLCLGKGITGGYLALSATLTTDKIYQAFYHEDIAKAFLHSHSYTGNPLACAAACAVLDIFENDNILAKNQENSQKIRLALQQQLSKIDRIKNFRQTGMITAFDVNTDDGEFPRKFAKLCLQEELLLRPSYNTVYVLPPFTINDDEIEHLALGIKNALTDYFNNE